MIKIEHDKTNQIEMEISGKFQSTDFDQLSEVFDQLIKKHGSIKIFVNSSQFAGWDDLSVMQKHFNFVQSHHDKVDKFAVIQGPWWQNFMLGFAKIFIHPKVKFFELSEIEEAKKWLKN